MNEVTQQIHDVILTSAELCKKKSVSRRNKMYALEKSKRYDAECGKQRQICKSEELKRQRDIGKVKYQRLYKMKCRIYSEEQTNIWCNTEYIDKKLFWKQIEVPRPISDIPVSLKSFRDFYSKLFSCQFNDSCTTDTYNVIVEELDRNISINKIEKSIKHLKPGKAAGSDNVISELITNGGAALKTTILELFNTLYDCGYYPEQ